MEKATNDPRGEMLQVMKAFLCNLVQITIDSPAFRDEFGTSLNRTELRDVAGITKLHLIRTFNPILFEIGLVSTTQEYAANERLIKIVIDSVRPLLVQSRSSKKQTKSSEAQATLTAADRDRLTNPAMKMALEKFTRQWIEEALMNIQEWDKVRWVGHEAQFNKWQSCIEKAGGWEHGDIVKSVIAAHKDRKQSSKHDPVERVKRTTRELHEPEDIFPRTLLPPDTGVSAVKSSFDHGSDLTEESVVIKIDDYVIKESLLGADKIKNPIAQDPIAIKKVFAKLRQEAKPVHRKTDPTWPNFLADEENDHEPFTSLYGATPIQYPFQDPRMHGRLWSRALDAMIADCEDLDRKQLRNLKQKFMLGVVSVMNDVQERRADEASQGQEQQSYSQNLE